MGKIKMQEALVSPLFEYDISEELLLFFPFVLKVINLNLISNAEIK